ncbi:MAG TPA: hypothetical protein VFB58_12885 [Chloroflexota bacterium]|nr:hypothetical protein [Chloroflexota bacterium]
MRVISRFSAVFAAAALLLLFVQPAGTFAQGTYSAYKDISGGFSCAAPPADLTAVAYSTTTSTATPGQCVAIRVGLVNTTGQDITGLTLSDTLPTGLTGCAFVKGAASATCPAPTNPTSNTGCYFAGLNPNVVCTVSSSGLAVSTTSGYTCPATGYTTAPGCYEIFVAQVAANACGSIGNTGNATATSPTGLTSTTPNGAGATLIVTSCTAATPSVTKSVEVNGVPYAGTAASPAPAAPGNTLTYVVKVTNGTGAPLSGVTVTDSLQTTGEAALIPAGYTQCSFTSPTFTCPVGTLAAGASATVVMYAVVLSGFSGTITNTAKASYTSGPAGGVSSNTTYVVVGPTTPTSGTLTVCGPVTAYLPPTTGANGSVTISGLTIPLAMSAASASFAVTSPTTSLCAQFAITNGVATAVAIGQNLSAQLVACGVYAPSSTAGQVILGGVPVTFVAGTVTTGLVAGGYYCALLTTSGQAYAFLTAVPTAVTAAPTGPHGAHAYHMPFES